MPVLDFRDTLYTHAAVSILKPMDAIYIIAQCISLQVLGFKLTTVFCIALLAGPFWVNGGSNIVYFIFMKH